MAYTKTESKSWFTRLSESVGGVVAGIALIVIGTWLLWWNEEDTFKTAGAIGEAELVTQEVQDITKSDPALEGKVIHAIGYADTQETLKDPIFGAEARAISIKRGTEYYQWTEHSHSETRKKLGGGEETVTTYTYSKEWVSNPVDSNRFEDPSYRDKNLTLTKVDDETFWASKVTFGAYVLPDFLKHSIGGSVSMRLDNVDTASIASAVNLPSNVPSLQLVHVQGSTIYLGTNPNSPAIGDVRVTFSQIPPADVSIIAQVIRDTFEPFKASNGYTFSSLKMGKVGAASMFESARSTNNLMAWLFRAIGAICVMAGIGMILKPLSVVADVIPILGTIVGAGAGIVAFLLGLAWSLMVIAVAWLRFRPLIAGGLIAAAVVLIVLLHRRGSNKADA